MRNRRNHIAIIYEGEKTEKTLVEKMQEVFFREVAETVVISFPACGNIYMIWNKLRENNFSIDVIDVVREMSPEAGKLLEGYSSRDFSEVYLFFDYDAHNNNLPLKYRSRNVIRELLDTFDNETENGKLYISYPMVESLREIHSETEDYRNFYVSLDVGEAYKREVAEELEFRDFRRISRERWEVACRASVKRAHLIVDYKESIPTYREFLQNLTQAKIYEAQWDHFVCFNRVVGILNGIPLLLLEYFKESFWNHVMSCLGK